MKLVSVAVWVLFLNVFFFHPLGSLGTSVILAGLWALALALWAKKDKTLPWISAASGVVGLALIANLWVGSAVRTAIGLAIVFLTMGYGVYLMMVRYVPRGLLETALSIPRVVWAYFQAGLSMLRGIIEGKLPAILGQICEQGQKRSKTGRAIFTGLLVGLPVVAWLLWVLTKADPAFAEFVGKVVSAEFLRQVPERIFMSLFFLTVFLPSVVMRQRRKYVSPLVILTKFDWGVEMTVVVIMVTMVMGSFLVVQWPYVFARVATEAHLSTLGVATYSEYVRRGFGELLQVAVAMFGLSWLVLVVKRSTKNQGVVRTLVGVQVLLGLEFVIFVTSIFRRVILYTQYHGLSLARLYGLAGLIWLIGMAIMLAWRFKRGHNLTKYELGWTILALFVTMSINMEAIVVATPPTVNGNVDYVYLSRMSPDGYTGWVQALDWSKTVLQEADAQKNILGRDMRRKVKYASWIVENLQDSETRLTRWTSNDEPWMWNYRDATVLAKMEKEMPKAELEGLHELAIHLNSRIANQPEGERDFELDISQNSPFLQ